MAEAEDRSAAAVVVAHMDPVLGRMRLVVVVVRTKSTWHRKTGVDCKNHHNAEDHAAVVA